MLFRSCNATYNNPLKIKKAKPKVDKKAIRLTNLIQRFTSGLIKERPTLRKLISITKGYMCSICGISEWNGYKITLIVDHIDGNAGNNLPDNVRLVCPNCNSQTPTFGGRNKGNGRKSRGLPRN